MKEHTLLKHLNNCLLRELLWKKREKLINNLGILYYREHTNSFRSNENELYWAREIFTTDISNIDKIRVSFFKEFVTAKKRLS